jgi:hypothetical protein
LEELAEGARTMPAVVDVQDAEPACWGLHIAPPVIPVPMPR